MRRQEIGEAQRIGFCGRCCFSELGQTWPNSVSLQNPGPAVEQAPCLYRPAPGTPVVAGGPRHHRIGRRTDDVAMGTVSELDVLEPPGELDLWTPFWGTPLKIEQKKARASLARRGNE